MRQRLLQVQRDAEEVARLREEAGTWRAKFDNADFGMTMALETIGEERSKLAAAEQRVRALVNLVHRDHFGELETCRAASCQDARQIGAAAE